jgi:hypothetical protein
MERIKKEERHRDNIVVEGEVGTARGRVSCRLQVQGSGISGSVRSVLLRYAMRVCNTRIGLDAGASNIKTLHWGL